MTPSEVSGGDVADAFIIGGDDDGTPEAERERAIGVPGGGGGGIAI